MEGQNKPDVDWYEQRWSSLRAHQKLVLLLLCGSILVFLPWESDSGHFVGFKPIIQGDDRWNIAWEFILLELSVVTAIFLIQSSRRSVIQKYVIGVLFSFVGSILYPPFTWRNGGFRGFMFILDGGRSDYYELYWGMLVLEWLLIIGSAILLYVIVRPSQRADLPS